MLIKYIFPALIILASASSCHTQPRSSSLVVKSSDPRIHYMGRVMVKEDTAELSWTATSVDINFTGTGAKALLKDELGENYYNVIVDGRVVAVIHPDQTGHLYDLVSGLPPGAHRLELFKRTESAMGKTWLYQFEFDPNTVVLAATPARKRKIEFFGNSITCGYAVEDTTGRDRGTSPYENAYIGYAAITARHSGANTRTPGSSAHWAAWMPSAPAHPGPDTSKRL